MTDGFLSRWSRLKAEKKAEKAETGEPVTEAPPAAPPEAEAAEEPLDLPAIDSLTKDSDFSPFLRAGVPEELRKAALSRLWASDPLFSKPEIYDLHMEDYTQPALPEMVKTAWRFGKGMLDAVDDHANFTDAPEETHKEANGDDERPSKA